MILVLAPTDFVQWPRGGTLSLLRGVVTEGSLDYLFVGVDTTGSFPLGRLTRVDTPSGSKSFFFVMRFTDKKSSRIPITLRYMRALYRYRRSLLGLAEGGAIYSHRVGLEAVLGVTNTIVHIHGAKTPTDYGRWGSVPNYLYEKLYEYSLRRALGVIFASKEAADKWSHLALRSKVVLNGFDDSVFHSLAQADVRAELKISPGEFVLVTVARLTENKRLDMTIKAFSLFARSVPLSRYYILGDGPEMVRLKAVVKSLALSERVFFLGTRDPHFVSQVLNAADLFTLASRAEAFNISILESLGCGTPVVCTDFDDVKMVVRDGETGFVVPATAEDLARAYLRLAKSGGKVLMQEACTKEACKYGLKEYVGKIDGVFSSWLQLAYPDV